MLKENQGLILQPITASIESSIQEKLLLFSNQVQKINETVEGFLLETESFEATLKEKAKEDQNTPLDI